MRQRVVRLSLLVSLAPPFAAWAQAPAGAEFRVNTTTFLTQSESAVAADAAGNFVVVWESTSQDGDGLGVFGQRFNAQGLPRGSEFQVNTFNVAEQARPSVAFPAPGTFVVVWQSRDQDGSSYGVFGQLFNALGAPQGPEFRVNTSTGGPQRHPSIAAAPGGGFVVVWESEVAPSNSEVFGQRFDASGTPQGAEFQVNTFTGGEQRYPTVAADASGNFVVGWQSDGQDGSGYGILGQRFDAQGVAQGAEFIVNSFTTGAQRFPSVASDAAGKFLMAWDSEAQDGNGRGIFAQRFDAGGLPQGSEFWVQTYVAGDQSRPSVAADPSGTFLVAWEGVGSQDADGVFGRFFHSSGLTVGPRFLIHTHTPDAQAGVSVAATSHGGFVATWQSDLQDGSEWGVYAQRFADLIFRDGFEPGNAAPVAADDAFDVDEEGTLAGTSVLANDTDAENDFLTAVLVSDVSNGDLILNADGTFEYTPGPDFSGTDSFTYHAHDGTQASNVATVTLTVNAVNDPPVVAAGGLLVYTEDDAAAVVDGGVTATDVDSASLAGATVQITANYASGQDVLSFVNTPGITGVFNAGTGTLTLTGTDTVANYQAALRTVRYNNTSQAPSTSPRTVTWIADDGAAANNLSLPATSTINVTSVNDAPALTAGATLGYTENQAATAIDGTVTVTDVDGNIASATVQIAANYQNGADVLSFINTASITGSFVAGTGVLTLTGTDTPANYQLALRSVRYHNTSETPSTTARTVVWQVNDGAGANNLSNTPTSTINVTAVNDAPTATAKAHSTHSGIRITIGPASTGKLLQGATDPDDPVGDLTASATFTAVTPAGATATLLDPATGTFTYNPPAGYSGAASFQFTVCDDGVPVAPSQCSASQTVSFTVTGPDLWFVNVGAAGGGTGRLTDPFNSLASLPGGRGPGDRIFVASGTYPTGHTLLGSEQLIGQGSSGGFDTVLGVIVPGNGTLDARPGLGGAPPTLQGTVTMGTSSLLRGVAISSGAATGFVATGAANITVLESSVSSAATAVSVSASTAASPAGVNFTTTTSTAGANGILLVNADGVFSFGGGSLGNNSVAAFALTNTAAHAPTITYTGNVTPAVNARAVDIGGAGAGSGLTGGSVTLSGSLTTTFSGGATANAGGVRVRNGTGGALTFSGLNKTFNAGPNNGVELATNPGVAISFTGGGLDIDTTSGAGFTASGGGTVAVTTGTNANTIDSTTGTALNVANTTIGGTGLTFQRISSNGGTATGIILDTTGALGGLTVNGDGTNTAVGGNGSGGAIANKSGADNSTATGIGIYLNNTRNVVLRRMTINGTNQNYGIRGNLVTGFTLEYATVNGTNGTAASLPFPESYGEGSIYFGNATAVGLTGSATITGCIISGGRARNVSVVNAGGTLNRLTITGSTFGLNQSTGNQSLAVEARNSGTIVNATLTGSTFSGSPGDLINFTGQTATTMDVVVQNNTLTNTHPQNIIGGGGVTLATQGVMTLNYSNNTQSGANGSAITLQKASAGTSMSGTLNGNTIGVSGVAGSGSQTGNGIFFSFAGGGQITLAVTNNTIRQYAGNAGIYADNTGGTYNLDLTATGNNTSQPGAGAFAGLALAAGAPASGDDIDVCANITGNNFSAGDPANANDAILGVSTAASSIRLPGYAGATLADVQNFVLANNNFAGTVVSAYVDPPATAANFVGGAACLTP